jgi:hypothetical protein
MWYLFGCGEEKVCAGMNVAESLVGKINKTKIRNVLDMAFTFAAMNRVFERGAKERIVQRLEMTLSRLTEVADQSGFDKVHRRFCEWFTKEINTAARRGRGKQVRPSRPSSYGHAAKVFDVASKVYVYYCHLPERKTAERLLPFVHSAVDTAMMSDLKKRYPKNELKARTIGDVAQTDYYVLQKLISKHNEEEFGHASLHPVQYDDIVWERLNRRRLAEMRA